MPADVPAPPAILALYEDITDHFIHFCYRFVLPLAGALEFRGADEVCAARVGPHMSDYMGRYVFEDICMQYLRKQAANRHGLAVERAGRYWSRDGRWRST